MLLQIRGKNSFDDEESKSVELGLVEMYEPVVFWVREKETPHRGDVVTLQHRTIIVEDRL